MPGRLGDNSIRRDRYGGCLPIATDHPFCACGFDERRERGRLWDFDVTGGRYEEREYVATGSGSLHAGTVVKLGWREDLDRDSAIDLACRALWEAADADSATGGPDLLLTSGGVSMGAYDTVKEVLTADGGVEFVRVAIRPGMPQGCGLVGPHRTAIVTLPGNPVSAYVSFETFVLPAIRRMMGKLPYSRPTARARLTHGLSSPAGKQQMVRGAYDVDRGGAFVAPVGGHGSHLIGDLATSNALIVVPPDVTALSAGDMVQVLRLDEEF